MALDRAFQGPRLFSSVFLPSSIRSTLRIVRKTGAHTCEVFTGYASKWCISLVVTFSELNSAPEPDNCKEARKYNPAQCHGGSRKANKHLDLSILKHRTYNIPSQKHSFSPPGSSPYYYPQFLLLSFIPHQIHQMSVDSTFIQNQIPSQQFDISISV